MRHAVGSPLRDHAPAGDTVGQSTRDQCVIVGHSTRAIRAVRSRNTRGARGADGASARDQRKAHALSLAFRLWRFDCGVSIVATPTLPIL